MAENTATRSVRMSVELWAFVIERAKERAITPNAWMTRCVKDAKKRLEGK